jgi:Fur family ferric uptake transcriptional regulator
VRAAWWHEQFRKQGCRITVPRKVIVEALSNAENHLSAEDLYLIVHKQYPAIGLTTVYRTLDLLAGMGLVLKFDFGDGRARYEIAAGPRARCHHHMICQQCGRVINFSERDKNDITFIQKMEKRLSKKYRFTILAHHLQFLGLCDECCSKGKTGD